MPLLAQICAAHHSATPLRISGAGTWLDAGRPVSASATLSTRDLTGVIEYIPGDLVITVRAGTTLAELAQLTAEHDQMLALDPYTSTPGLDTSTIGAVVATASHGPLAHGFGRVRDLVLGCSFITGDGTIVRAGGRVVKNVAGFDLVRLTTGAWGTLGVITDVSLRLHARQPVDETFAIGIDDSASLDELVARLNSAPLLANTSSLASLVILSHDAPAAVRATCSVPRTPVVLLARAMGNRIRVDAQRAALATLGDVITVDPAVWRSVRTLDTGNTTLRLTDAPSRSAATLESLSSWCAMHHSTDVRMVIEPLRGTVRLSCHLPDNTHTTLPPRALPERLPFTLWHVIPSPIADTISQRLRGMFDPVNILNPRILG